MINSSCTSEALQGGGGKRQERDGGGVQNACARTAQKGHGGRRRWTARRAARRRARVMLQGGGKEKDERHTDDAYSSTGHQQHRRPFLLPCYLPPKAWSCVMSSAAPTGLLAAPRLAPPGLLPSRPPRLRVGLELPASPPLLHVQQELDLVVDAVQRRLHVAAHDVVPHVGRNQHARVLRRVSRSRRVRTGRGGGGQAGRKKKGPAWRLACGACLRVASRGQRRTRMPQQQAACHGDDDDDDAVSQPSATGAATRREWWGRPPAGGGGLGLCALTWKFQRASARQNWSLAGLVLRARHGTAGVGGWVSAKGGSCAARQAKALGKCGPAGGGGAGQSSRGTGGDRMQSASGPVFK